VFVKLIEISFHIREHVQHTMSLMNVYVLRYWQVVYQEVMTLEYFSATQLCIQHLSQVA